MRPFNLKQSFTTTNNLPQSVSEQKQAQRIIRRGQKTSIFIEVGGFLVFRINRYGSHTCVRRDFVNSLQCILQQERAKPFSLNIDTGGEPAQTDHRHPIGQPIVRGTISPINIAHGQGIEPQNSGRVASSLSDYPSLKG